MVTRQYGGIDSVDDLVRLNIVDFGRHNGKLFGGPHNAIALIAQHTVGTMCYTVIPEDYSTYPQRTDFPEWHHVGDHVSIARLYWNKFHALFPGSHITFGDSPDFAGTLIADRYSLNFCGDIGQVSPIAFLQSIQGMLPGDLWISILGNREVVLEAQLQHPLNSEFLELGFPGSPSKLPSTDEEVMAWFKARGYDPHWTHEEYTEAYANYLETHRLRPGLSLETDTLAIPKTPRLFYQSRMFE